MKGMRHLLLPMIGTVVLCSSHASSADLEQAQEAAADSASVAGLNGLIDEYCTGCHNSEDYAGGIDLIGINPENVDSVAEIGEKVIRRLRAGMMPPVGEPRPGVETMQALASAMEERIDAHSVIAPGRPGLHRLNRIEYQNAIRDLLALEIDVSDYLPADDSSRGFDNQAGALALSPALLEAYFATARKVSEMAIGSVVAPQQMLYRVEEDANQNFRIEGLPYGTRGGLKFKHNFPVDGEYNFRIFPITLGNMGSSRPFGDVRGEQLELLVDGELAKLFDWDQEMGIGQGSGRGNDEEEEGGDNQPLPTIDVTVPMKAGPHEVGFTFLANNYAPLLDMNNDFERSTLETGGIVGFTFYPHIGSVRVDGPYNPGGADDTPSRNEVFSCYPADASEEESCARQIIADLSDVAFRGYGSADDVEMLMGFYSRGRERGSFDKGIEMALQRLLISPKFIYRMEPEPEGLAAGETYAISDLDLASRLSFFLWSSIPDAELLSLAKAGRLSDPDMLDQQVRRMLSDPKSEAMTRNFAGQWLALRSLDTHVPVMTQFPDFDNLLRQSFKRETELVFDSLIRENRPVMELLTADYTFVNERLAMHYNIPGIVGERFRRVDLTGDLAVRRGILGKGSMLTVASQPGRTSPVMRGYWVLANLIGVEPPPPPPNVPALESKEGDRAGNDALPSMREQLESHRENPACQGCHRLMDPIGFALETFDAVGGYRTVDNGSPIDTTGVLYDGSSMQTSADLTAALVKYEDSIVRNFTQKLLTYALGRGMEYTDMPLVRKVKEEAARDGYRMQSLISAIVRSEAFLNNTSAGTGSAVAAADTGNAAAASITGGL